MDKIRAIKEAAALNPQAVFTQKARKKGYVCPLCGNGSGADGDGVTEDQSRPGHYHCFKCGYDGDILDWIGQIYHTDKKETIRQGMELYNIADDMPAPVKKKEPERQDISAEDEKRQREDAKKQGRQSFILKASEHAKRFDYLLSRGISEAVQRRFNIGYAEKYNGINKGCCIIPTAAGSFVARNVNRCENKYRYRKGGKSQLFNAEACGSGGVVFVTEGEIDALSVLEVGFNAMALGSAGNRRKLIDMYKENRCHGANLVLVLDNDEEGRRAAAELVEAVKAIDYSTMVLGNCKDPNEALQTERAAFALRLRTASEMAEKALETAADISALFNNEYSVKTDGSFWRVYPYKDGYKEQYLGDFWLKGISVITKDDGIEQTQYIKLQPFRKGKPLPAKEMTYKKFTSSALFEELDFSLRPAIGRSITQYYQDSVRMQFEYMDKQTIYTHTGWRQIGGTWVYLHCGGAIGTVAKDVAVELPDGRLNNMYTLSLQDSPDKWNTLKQFLECAEPYIIYPLLSYIFLAPLIEFFAAAECLPGFSFYLLGKSQSGKSTLAALALCFFGSFSNKTLPASFNDTANSIEVKGFVLKDTVIVIDDFCPSGSKREADEKNKIFEKLAAAYGDRLGRGRLTADSTLKENKPVRGLAIITGELLPQVAQSRLGRNVFITMQRDSERFKMHMLPVINNKEHLSQVMREYIAWLSDKADTLPQRLFNRFGELRATFESSDYGRIAEAAAFMAVSFELLVDFLLEVGAFTYQEAAKHKGECFAELKGLAAAQQDFMEDAEPCKIFLETLNSLIAAGGVFIRHCLDVREKEECSKPLIGYMDEKCYYLLPQEAYKAVYKACGDKGGFFPLGFRDLSKELADKDIIPTQDGRYYKKKSIKCTGKQERCWWIRKSDIEDIN